MKKERKIKGHYTLVDTYNATEFYDYKSFKDYCEAGYERQRFDIESEEDWYQWAQEQANEDYDCFMTNLKYSNLYGRAVIVEGSLGLWWGHPDIGQKYFDNPVDAIRACISGAYDVIIKKVGHRLEVVNLHHDGRNYFTLTFLTPLGEGRYLDHGQVSTKNRENFIKLPEYLF